ncbi:MAG: WYL domain-containing protein [Paludibacteraceae bacterium]|nr:WYL domain-containing protein [Paludibacteraceae bacterium]
MRTLPLHFSQKEEKHEEYSIFKYNIKIDDEFKSELLKWGSSIRVLEPLSLHDDIVKEIKKLSEMYNS